MLSDLIPPFSKTVINTMSNPIALAIHGAAGRMGRRLVALGSQDPGLKIVAALDHAASPHLGHDAGTVAGIGPIGVEVTHGWPTNIQALIDFSSPEGCMNAISECVERKIPVVVASTGLTAEQVAKVTRRQRRFLFVTLQT